METEYHFLIISNPYDDHQEFHETSWKAHEFKEAIKSMLSSYVSSFRPYQIRDIEYIYGIKDGKFYDCYEELALFKKVIREKEVADMLERERRSQELKEKLERDRELEEYKRLKAKYG
jgi:tryptophan 2,3-dioxygenase